MNISKQEIESVSKLEPFKRYKYFIKKIADFEELWTLIDKKGDLVISHVDDNNFLSFWTAEAFVQKKSNKEWKDCTPIKLDLDNFEETIMPLIMENKYLIDVFPVNGKSGFVVDINEFTRDLNEELEQYN